MSIEDTLASHYKESMKAKDSAKVACIRQLRSKVQEATNAKGFSGETDDALYQKIIGSYCKSLEKAIAEMTEGGAQSSDVIDGYRVEIDYLSQFLPKLLGEAETQAIVDQVVSQVGAFTQKEVGRVMGQVMKDHKGKVDPGLVKKLVASKASE